MYFLFQIAHFDQKGALIIVFAYNFDIEKKCAFFYFMGVSSDVFYKFILEVLYKCKTLIIFAFRMN